MKFYGPNGTNFEHTMLEQKVNGGDSVLRIYLTYDEHGRTLIVSEATELDFTGWNPPMTTAIDINYLGCYEPYRKDYGLQDLESIAKLLDVNEIKKSLRYKPDFKPYI